MTSQNNVFSIDFESEKLIKLYKKEMLRGVQRHMIRGMTPIECRIKGTRQLGFTKFEEGTEYDHFKVYIPDADVYVSLLKSLVLEIDGRELASLIAEKYKEHAYDEEDSYVNEEAGLPPIR